MTKLLGAGAEIAKLTARMIDIECREEALVSALINSGQPEVERRIYASPMAVLGAED